MANRGCSFLHFTKKGYKLGNIPLVDGVYMNLFFVQSNVHIYEIVMTLERYWNDIGTTLE